MSDSMFNSGSLDDDKTKLSSELQEFLTVERQRAQLNSQILEFNESCWDKCVDKPASKLDGKTESCLTNCVERFIDTSLFITQRFAQMLQKSTDKM